MLHRPHCVILAGPNGAGKSTHAQTIVADIHNIGRHINPDTIAAGFGSSSPDAVAFDAGRIALRAIDSCVDQRVNFAFETTLSGRRWPRLLDRLDACGYVCSLHYLWIPDAETCVDRVRQRVASGGHDVNNEDIRRRHASSQQNLFTLFMGRVHAWNVYDASSGSGLALLAIGGKDRQQHIADPERWRQLTLAATPRLVREVSRYAYPETGSMGDPMDDFASRAATDSARQDASGSVYMPAPELIIAASRIAVRRALAIQRALGVSAVAMRDGKMVIIPPEELPIDINDVDWDTRERASPTKAAGEPT